MIDLEGAGDLSTHDSITLLRPRPRHSEPLIDPDHFPHSTLIDRRPASALGDRTPRCSTNSPSSRVMYLSEGVTFAWYRTRPSTASQEPSVASTLLLTATRVCSGRVVAVGDIAANTPI